MGLRRCSGKQGDSPAPSLNRSRFTPHASSAFARDFGAGLGDWREGLADVLDELARQP